ncbi:hypothetical protein Bbelb_143150 [Branchiostoma belcheri]|nr:hypothetical protein Bbelb_143150 [Branchiostoma belcheri]
MPLATTRRQTDHRILRDHRAIKHKATVKATVTTRRACFCVLSTCKNVGNRTASVRGEYHLPYERATYGLRESNFTILTCNCCTDSARSTCVPHTVLASSVLTPHFPVDLLNDHAKHTCTIPVYKDDLTGDCQLVSKMPRKAQKKTTRQDPKKRAAEDTRAASDDEVNRRCTHLQRASTACTRQRSNRTEIVRCKHVQLTYHLRNVRCTQPLTARRVVQTTVRTTRSESKRLRDYDPHLLFCPTSKSHGIRTGAVYSTMDLTCGTLFRYSNDSSL